MTAMMTNPMNTMSRSASAFCANAASSCANIVVLDAIILASIIIISIISIRISLVLLAVLAARQFDTSRVP